MTRFRGTRVSTCRAGASFSQLQIKSKGLDPCPGFAPDSLVQREQECVSGLSRKPGRACATKAEEYSLFLPVLF